ncbi:SNF2-related protein [Vibrio sp.]|uniref:SNF2-related protein n=1 Tax=Vibrio sp. TaxID=678 RepID=UPI003797287A
MYRFKLKTPLDTVAFILVSTAWDVKSLVEIQADPTDKTMISDFLKFHGMTPDGRLASLPDMAPMSIHYSFNSKAATDQGWTCAIEEGEALSYPHRDVVFDSASDDVELTLKTKTFTLQDRYQFQGLPISIENKAGSKREGIDPDGHKWSVPMHADYGYIRSTLGADDEGIDCYVGDNRKAEHVYIIKQHAIEKVKKWGSKYCPDCKEHAHDCACPDYFDEDKVMLGFDNKEAAKQAYLKQYDSDLFLGPISTMSTVDFKAAINQAGGKKLDIPLQFVHDSAEEQVLDRANIPQISGLLAANNINELEQAFLSLMEQKEPAAFGLKSGGVKTREALNAKTKAIVERIKAADWDTSSLTDEERSIIVQYSGRGGLTENNQFEYFTPTYIAEGCWDLLKANGFENGNVLEPSTGAGVFSATKTQGVKITGTEIDPTSSGVNKILHPEDTILNQSFEKLAVEAPDNHYDSVIGNVPFGSARGASAHDDPDHKNEKLIERYFINRLIDKVKPNGLLVLVVPVNICREKGKTWQKWRNKISKKAEFMGAHKLPSKTFGKQGTSVVTDIIVLRKHSTDAAEKIQNLKAKQLRDINVIWDTFIEGRWWNEEGKAFIQGKFVPKDATKIRDDDKVIRDGALTDEALKRKLASKFTSRIDWEALDVAEPVITNYAEGDRRVIDEQTFELKNGNWESVDTSPEATTAIDKKKYGVSTLEELKGLLSSNQGSLKLSVHQAFAAMKAWKFLFSQSQRDAIEFAMSQPDDKYREQIYRGSLIGADLAKFQNAVNQGDWDVSDQMRLQELVADEVNHYGHPKQNKGLLLAGDRSRYFGVFSTAMDESGEYSALLTGESSTKGLAFDDTNPSAIVEHLYIREGLTDISLDDVQQLYKGKTPINALSDLADDKTLAIDADGNIMPMSRYCSGDVYQKVVSLSTALALESDAKLKAKYQQQLQEIESRRTKTATEDIAFSMRHKWIDRKYVLEFMKEKGFNQLDYQVSQTVVKKDEDTGESYVDTETVRDTSSPFGEFSGYEDSSGYYKQLNRWLNGKNVTSSKQEYLEEYREKVANLDNEFRVWMQQHQDADDLSEIYNQKFNSYIPLEHSTSDLGLEGVSKLVKPHGYQCAAVRRLSEEGTGILGFDVGLGKTFSALALAAYNKQMGRATKTLIVVPNSVLANWYHEAKMFHGNLDHALFVGFKPKMDKDGVIKREVVKDEKGEPKKNKHTQEIEYQDILVKESAQEIYEKMHQIPQTSKSLIVMTFEKFKEIQMRPASKQKYADKWTEKSLMSDQLAAKQVLGDDVNLGKGKDKLSYKDAVRKTSLQQRFLEDGGHKKGEFPYYEDMGFKSVIVDEAHSFKNSFKAGDNTGDIAYLPTPAESQRAIDMAMKMAYLRDQNEGRGSVLLSATPVTNSPMEIFNMLSLVLPVEEFEKFGIYTVDDFIRVFGKIATVDKMTVKGEIVQKDGLVGFQNLDGLRNLFHRYTNMKNADDVNLKLPDAPESHESVEMNAEQHDAYETLREEAKESSKPAFARNKNARALFAVMRDMDKVTTDMDLYNQTMTFTFPTEKADQLTKLIESLPQTITTDRFEQNEEGQEIKVKVDVELDYSLNKEGDTQVLVVPDVFEQAVIDRLVDVGIDQADVSHPLTPKYAKLIANLQSEYDIKGKQIIFTEEKTQHHKLKRIIVNQLGIDESEVGIINGTDAAGAKLQRIADSYNAGSLKIVICNKKAEVGVNLQKGTSAIHHLTLPWTPASIQQRNGRGVRQGNTAKRVSIFYYLGKGSFDGYRLDLLNKKSSWMRDLFTGDEAEAVNGNAVDNDDYLDMFESDPAAAKAKRMEKLAKRQAEQKRKSDLKCSVDLSQVISNRQQLDSWEADKANDYNKLFERKTKAEIALNKSKEAGNDTSKHAQVLARANQALQEHAAKWDDTKQKLESRLTQRMTFLRQKDKAGELPFDSAVLDNPDKAIVARNGSVLVAGDCFESSNRTIIEVLSVNAKARTVGYSVVTGHVSYRWWGSSVGSHGDQPAFEGSMEEMPEDLKKVSYSPDEIAERKLLSMSYNYADLQKLTKEQFLKYRDTLQLGYSTALWRTEDGLKAASPRGEDCANLVYPDLSDASLKKEVATTYLELTRRNDDSYDWRNVMTAFFGNQWRDALSEYGEKASQGDVLAKCAEMWAELQPKFNDAATATGGPLALARKSAFRGAIRLQFNRDVYESTRTMGDNKDDIEDWVSSYLDGITNQLAEEAMQVERAQAQAELDEIKKHPDYKELSPQIETAFLNIGITARYNIKEVNVPAKGRRRGTTLPALKHFFLQDKNGKNGKLFDAKDILKARYGARYMVGDGDYAGSWWYFPSTVDIQAIFEIID